MGGRLLVGEGCVEERRKIEERVWDDGPRDPRTVADLAGWTSRVVRKLAHPNQIETTTTPHPKPITLLHQ